MEIILKYIKYESYFEYECQLKSVLVDSLIVTSPMIC